MIFSILNLSNYRMLQVREHRQYIHLRNLKIKITYKKNFGDLPCVV